MGERSRREHWPPCAPTGFVVEVRNVGARDGEQLAVAEHGALRRAGRAGCEDDGHQAVIIRIERRRLFSGVLEPVDVARIDHDRGSGDIEYGGALTRRVPRVDTRGDGTDLGGGEIRDDVVDVRRPDEGHDITRRDASVEQAARDRITASM